VAGLSGDELAALRNRLIGFVFQGFNLLKRVTAADNVALPSCTPEAPSRAQRWARALLERVGIGGQARSLPNQMSGGQQQRVAIARALACEPALILATSHGNLDTHTAARSWTCSPSSTASRA